jgi:checkpoint serine/threonine-protein kinase
VSKTAPQHERETVNPRTGKPERVFVNLEAVYPDRDNPSHEMSFEELRAISRGWMDRDWASEKTKALKEISGNVPCRDPIMEQDGSDSVDKTLSAQMQEKLDLDDRHPPSSDAVDLREGSRDGKSGKARRLKLREVKAETQTSKYLRFCSTECQLVALAAGKC